MKITHIYPQAGSPFCKDQTPIGNGDTEVEVWEEIRTLTMRDGGVLFVETHQYATDDFLEELRKGQHDSDLVTILSLTPITKKIHVPESGPYERKLVRANVEQVGMNAFRRTSDTVVAVELVPAKPATTKEIVVDRYLDCSTKKNARFIASKVATNSLVVFWEPDVEGGDLDYLSELPTDLHVVIFHRVSEKVGVEVEGDVDPENWEEEFPALVDVQLEKQKVIVDELLIAGNIHTVAGPPGTFKTMGLIELSSAILDERPVFDLLKVNSRHPILFLCADMSPAQLNEWAEPFNLRKHGTDFRVQKGNILHKVDDPVLQRAVKGCILILDTMLDYAQIQKAFESGEWITFMQKLRTLITVHGCIAIVMTAHSTRAEVKSESDNVNAGEYFKDSVTFHGKVDVGFGCKVLKDTSQVKWERIKHRGFKKHKFSFTVAVLDDEGHSNLDRGRFPVCNRPEDMKEFAESRKDKGGVRPNPHKHAIAQQIRDLKNEGKNNTQIAEQLELSVSTVKRYKSEFDSDQGATND